MLDSMLDSIDSFMSTSIICFSSVTLSVSAVRPDRGSMITAESSDQEPDHAVMLGKSEFSFLTADAL